MQRRLKKTRKRYKVYIPAEKNVKQFLKIFYILQYQKNTNILLNFKSIQKFKSQLKIMNISVHAMTQIYSKIREKKIDGIKMMEKEPKP